MAVFICCWMPNQIFNFLRDYNSLPSFIESQDYLWGIITHCISIMWVELYVRLVSNQTVENERALTETWRLQIYRSTVWNPVLYALLNEQFRVAFKSLLNTLRGRPSQVQFYILLIVFVVFPLPKEYVSSFWDHNEEMHSWQLFALQFQCAHYSIRGLSKSIPWLGTPIQASRTYSMSILSCRSPYSAYLSISLYQADTTYIIQHPVFSQKSARQKWEDPFV